MERTGKLNVDNNFDISNKLNQSYKSGWINFKTDWIKIKGIVKESEFVSI